MSDAAPLAGTVVSVNVSAEKGTRKTPVPRARIGTRGLDGDAHAGAIAGRDVSLLSRETIDAFASRTGRATAPGEFAENLTTAGIDTARVGLLDRIEAGGALLEVARIGKSCHGAGCAIMQSVGSCAMPKEGLFARVLREGEVAPGDPLLWHPRPLRLHVVTVSDRASRGEYEDASGPAARERLSEHFAPTRWHPQISASVVPDEPSLLRRTLEEARAAGADVIVTTGGTGIGPRDITPEVVLALADRTIPGIMEQVRMKHGAVRPAAVLSRSVAAVAGRTLLYALPGSPRAVEEYLDEILKTLEHALCVLNGLDPH